MSDVIKLTQDLIRCPSVTPEDRGALVLLSKVLEDAGFTCYHLPFSDEHETVPNLFARIGEGGAHICYAGHTDVVPPGPEEDWTFGPFNPTIKDGILYGRGASDMKGSVAAFACAAIRYIKQHGAPENGSISMLITGDEEALAVNGTIKVLQWMAENGHVPDVSLVGEPSNPDHLGQEIKIGRRGSVTGEIVVRGKQGHVAYPQRADNPLPRLIKIADALSDYVFDNGTDFFQPTNLEITTIDVGNTADNVIPAKGFLRFNIRFNDTWTGESLIEKLHEIVKGACGEHAYEMNARIGSRSFLTQPGAWSDVVQKSVQDVTGLTPKLSTGGGTSDARFMHEYCPVDQRDHSPD
jgi:succinyl-diaminopimelate desuccinylase